MAKLTPQEKMELFFLNFGGPNIREAYDLFHRDHPDIVTRQLRETGSVLPMCYYL